MGFDFFRPKVNNCFYISHICVKFKLKCLNIDVLVSNLTNVVCSHIIKIGALKFRD